MASCLLLGGSRKNPSFHSFKPHKLSAYGNILAIIAIDIGVCINVQQVRMTSDDTAFSCTNNGLFFRPNDPERAASHSLLASPSIFLEFPQTLHPLTATW